MKTILRWSLATCALLVAIDAAAQTMPPANPYMGPPGTATMHANAASSNATTNPGPGSGAVMISSTNFGAVFSTILMGSDGMIVSVATQWTDRTPWVYLLDPTTLEPLATKKLVKSTTSDMAGGIYSYLDNDNRLVLVNADGELLRISYSQQTSGSWQLNVASQVQIGYPDVVGLVPDYQGRIWFATAQGTSGTSSGAVVGYYDPTSEQTSAFTLPAGEQVANSISSSPTGVAVASTSALYLFQSGSSGPQQVWRDEYDRGPARKPGQLSWGTGATPVFFGPDTGYEYLTITDNAAPQENVLVYQTTSGTLIGSVPFLISGTNSGNEDAAIAVGNSVFYPSTYGYEYPQSAESGTSIPASAPFVGGMQRVDVLPGGSGLTTTWQSSVVSAGEPRLSLADNLIYTIGLDTTTGVYSLVTVDPATGVQLSSTPYGSALGDNPLQMVSLISPSGVLYQGTKEGIVRVEAIVPEPSTIAMALAGLACGGSVVRWRRTRVELLAGRSSSWPAEPPV